MFFNHIYKGSSNSQKMCSDSWNCGDFSVVQWRVYFLNWIKRERYTIQIYGLLAWLFYIISHCLVTAYSLSLSITPVFSEIPNPLPQRDPFVLQNLMGIPFGIFLTSFLFSELHTWRHFISFYFILKKCSPKKQERFTAIHSSQQLPNSNC